MIHSKLISGQNKLVDYAIKVRENKFVEKDDSKDYPHREYKSYSSCDDDFLASLIPPEVVPIWSTNNIKNVSDNLFIKDLSVGAYYGLIDGTQKSSCPMPCSTMYIESRFLQEADYDNRVIRLIFSEGVTVTKTDFIKFTFMMFLSDVGGSMGLWLGLGLLQALEMCIKLIFSKKNQ